MKRRYLSSAEKMNLKNLLAEGRIRSYQTTAREIQDLFRVVKRDLEDASIGQLSTDRRFATAYNAILQLATIVLYASGYRTAGAGHHWTTFQALTGIEGIGGQGRADYFDSCRIKRNLTDYDRVGEISDREAQAILEEAKVFRNDLMAWMKKRHRKLFKEIPL